VICSSETAAGVQSQVGMSRQGVFHPLCGVPMAERKGWGSILQGYHHDKGTWGWAAGLLAAV